MRKMFFLSVALLLASVWLHASPVEAQVALKFANFFPPDNKVSVVNGSVV